MATTPTTPNSATSASRAGEPEPDHCAQCGARLAEGQEWCLNCGSAQTLIYRPPDWRFPVLVVLVVIVIALAGFVFALNRLTNDAGRTASADAAASAAVTPTRSGQSATASTTQAGTVTAIQVAGIASWPVGLDGWTVVLNRFKIESQAYSAAQKSLASGLHVGVLDTSDHPSMRAGYWVVFSGRYPNRATARPVAAKLVGAGYASAHARQVAPPGGL
jgi:hypothetical protein